MALSNWDTLAFDTDGQPCDGVLEGFDGASAEIYKNWLYVRDPKMWHEKRGFIEPTIAQIDSGEVTISEFTIHATRHSEQEAMFVLVACHRYEPRDVRWMAGIGCSGYSNPSEAIARAAGVDLTVWQPISYGSSGGGGEEPHHIVVCEAADGRSETFAVPMKPEDELEAQWIGVTEETRDAFFAWLGGYVDTYNGPSQEWLATCRESGGLRFNQGDKYIAEHALGAGPGEGDIATPVGAAQEPLFMQMIKGLDEDDGEAETPPSS